MTDLNPISRHSGRWLALLLASGALALTACGDKGSNQTAGQKVDSAIAKTDQAGADAKAKSESAAASTKEAAKDAGAAVAGAVDDAAITAAVSTGLAKDPDLSAIKIDVDTKGGTVSLSGPAPNAAAKARAEEIAKSVKGVSAVKNNLEVKM
ncbi:BON domain-containing protein [Variovorax sp. J22P240]|uniref:BON domain-containing protein n=1 Tax=unclassified Variovorax TaxID=663243 RepID=UPI002575E6B1|nr:MULTISPECIES: BON domain-containing protein [unclassified Variovorax]MDM0000384.1 BON domain-containing protein [Variovorax sp. J22P240]MDM0051812.1 BON domain-containing protein [Variovorax sp. J22R115]